MVKGEAHEAGSGNGKGRSEAAMWKWVSGLLATVALMLAGGYVSNVVLYTQNAATRAELHDAIKASDASDADLAQRFEVRSQRIEENSRSIASLSAEVLSTLRAMQTQLTRLETDLAKLRDERKASP